MVAGVGVAGVGGGAALLGTGVLKGALDSFSLAAVNAGLVAVYFLLVGWGLAATIWGGLTEDTGTRVNAAAFIITSTVIHYGVTFGGPSVVEGFVPYPVEPHVVFRVLDVFVLLSASSLVVFFFAPRELLFVPIIGSGAMTASMMGQTYKATTILQGIWEGTRDELTGKAIDIRDQGVEYEYE